eukprot:1190789-Prorocentrum_minimum.AAC.3
MTGSTGNKTRVVHIHFVARRCNVDVLCGNFSRSFTRNAPPRRARPDLLTLRTATTVVPPPCETSTTRTDPSTRPPHRTPTQHCGALRNEAVTPPRITHHPGADKQTCGTCFRGSGAAK